MNIRFTKMHGLGNDFVVLHDRGSGSLPMDLVDFCRHYADRRFGIGFDQVLILRPSQKADFKMEIYNADGSQVEMCGNGIRCIAKYIWDRGLSRQKDLSIETLAGVMRLWREGDLVAVDMGTPVIGTPGGTGRPLLLLEAEDQKFGVTPISMGNPHAVIFVQDVAAFPVARYGPVMETHPAFPNRTNVEFVQVLGPEAIQMRVWERGAGETLACGTGACAAAVASHLNGVTGRRVRVQLTGGTLFISWQEDQHVVMIGPAVEVFSGELENGGTAHV